MILSVIGIGTYMQATVKSRDTQRKSNLDQMAKAIEAFYSDVGRYPHSDSQNNMYCAVRSGNSLTDVVCGDKLYLLSDGLASEYINTPSDPTTGRTYVYLSSDGQSYSFYAALENSNDRDLIKDGSGNVVVDPWGVNCGAVGATVPCNYKVNETGLVKSI